MKRNTGICEISWLTQFFLLAVAISSTLMHAAQTRTYPIFFSCLYPEKTQTRLKTLDISCAMVSGCFTTFCQGLTRSFWWGCFCIPFYSCIVACANSMCRL
eukprot:maker-scaffold_20-snap-gene-1.1-mRNA-1 protein AED:0.42 eAED:0.51 QI:0/0/0/1/0/0/2/0/100